MGERKREKVTFERKENGRENSLRAREEESGEKNNARNGAIVRKWKGVSERRTENEVRKGNRDWKIIKP
jgi:hypothetical protein